MKNHIFILLSLSLFALTACKKEKKEKPKSDATVFVDSFSLKQDGVLYTTNSPDVAANNTWIGVTAGTIGETGNFYQIGVQKNLLPGTYEYQGGMDDVIQYLMISDQLVYVINHGSVTVVSNDTVLKRMEFDFEFEMYEDNTHLDTIQITEGHARISYQ
jgi:hypothetical protein